MELVLKPKRTVFRCYFCFKLFKTSKFKTFKFKSPVIALDVCTFQNGSQQRCFAVQISGISTQTGSAQTDTLQLMFIPDDA